KAMKFFKGFEISFDVQDSKVVISCGGKQTSQIFSDKDEFLPIPEIDMATAQEYKYNIKDLKERFNLVKYATRKDNVKPIFTGIHFDGTNMVALDGYRIAMNTSNELNVSVPFTAQLNGLALMCDVLNRDINIVTNNKYISVSDGDTTVMSRLFEGVYLDYKQAIPNNENEVQVDMAEYSETLKYFKAFKKSGNKCQIIAWLNDSLMLLGTDNCSELSTLKGEFQDAIGFNNQYMLDALTQFKAENVKFNMSNSVTPIVIRDDEGNLALVLPIRLADEVDDKMKKSA
ncbi:MAG: DNA polymerase III subunit beta, partial [Oscillospiraceae bacterium]